VEPLFLSLEEVLEIHRQQIERYGGASGVRDLSLLESAIAQPQASFSNEFLHASIPAMAAACLFHICRNHPLVDGNKRVAANAAITFLSTIGNRLSPKMRWWIQCSPWPLPR
jgi:death-on-curing protein